MGSCRYSARARRCRLMRSSLYSFSIAAEALVSRVRPDGSVAAGWHLFLESHGEPYFLLGLGRDLCSVHWRGQQEPPPVGVSPGILERHWLSASCCVQGPVCLRGPPVWTARLGLGRLSVHSRRGGTPCLLGARPRQQPSSSIRRPQSGHLPIRVG